VGVSSAGVRAATAAERFVNQSTKSSPRILYSYVYYYVLPSNIVKFVAIATLLRRQLDQEMAAAAGVEARWAELQAAAPPRPTSAPSATALAALKAHRSAEKAFLSGLEPELRARLTGKRPKVSGGGGGGARGGCGATPVDALEFFSGIGGLHYGLAATARLATAQPQSCCAPPCAGPAGPDAGAGAAPPEGWAGRTLTVQPFEIHATANCVYAHNFGGHGGYRQPSTQDIRSLTAAQLDAQRAWLWLLSPPCQPYTRLGKRLDHEDPRAAALLHLIALLPQLAHPPTHMLLENVVGFEGSETARRLRRTLLALEYDCREFHISPTDLGLPNERRRYFLLARRRSSPSQARSDTVTAGAASGAGPAASSAAAASCGDDSAGDPAPPARVIPCDWEADNSTHGQVVAAHEPPACLPLSHFLDRADQAEGEDTSEPQPGKKTSFFACIFLWTAILLFAKTGLGEAQGNWFKGIGVSSQDWSVPACSSGMHTCWMCGRVPTRAAYASQRTTHAPPPGQGLCSQQQPFRHRQGTMTRRMLVAMMDRRGRGWRVRGGSPWPRLLACTDSALKLVTLTLALMHKETQRRERLLMLRPQPPCPCWGGQPGLAPKRSTSCSVTPCMSASCKLWSCTC
jgi:site-specific DNA-cytosine methylase